MARTLTAAAATGVEASVTAPRLLIYIGWSSPVRVCTRETVTWSGSVWTGPVGRVDGITGASTDQRARVILPNADNAYGAIALASGLHDVPVRVWALYGSEPFASGDAVQLFEGQADGGRITTMAVEVECIAMRQATIYAPRVYAQPPLMNHNPPAGTVLRWNGDIYTLERR